MKIPKVRKPRPVKERAAAGTETFDSHFRSHIMPHFQRLEDERRLLSKILTRRKNYIYLLVAVVVLILILSGYLRLQLDLGHYGPVVLIAVFVVSLIAMWSWSEAPRRAFRKAYKQTILPAIASYFGEFEYRESGGIASQKLEASSLMPDYVYYYHEDLFTGRYKDVSIEFCEAKLVNRQRVGNKEQNVTVFRGAIILLDRNTSFAGTTVVKRDAGMIGNWFRDHMNRKLKTVRLVDPKFEKRFEVYSDDQVEARYILEPAFMERLEDLAHSVGAGGLQAAFYGSSIMIMLPGAGRPRSGFTGWFQGLHKRWTNRSPGLFEPGSIFEPVHGTGDVERLVLEFRSILEIVNALKLR